MTRILPWLVLLLSVPAYARSGDVELLPDVTVRLRAALYAPAEPDFQWTGWVGAGAGLLRVKKVTAYTTADIETIVGNTRRTFDANQANYHLELGARRDFERSAVMLVFHHVSRHAVDRPKTQAVDWNILGVRATLQSPPSFPVPTRLTVGAGHTTQQSLINYRWEFTGRIESDLVTWPFGEVYLLADVRGVTADFSEEFPRSSFVDLSAEIGPRWTRGGRSFALFVAYERRNDVLLLTPALRTRALFGFRIGFAGDASSNTPSKEWTR